MCISLTVSTLNAILTVKNVKVFSPLQFYVTENNFIVLELDTKNTIQYMHLEEKGKKARKERGKQHLNKEKKTYS